MRKLFKYSLIGLTLLSCAALLGLYPYRAALLPQPVQPAQLKQQLAEHLTLFTPPQGSGPFPTVLAFHGCGGQRQSMVDNLNSWLLPAGYAVLFVDSFAARSIRDWQPVCDGKLLWGNERAQDVYAALELAAAMPQVDARRMAVMGFSHGGWAILDALPMAVQPDTALPGRIRMCSNCSAPPSPITLFAAIRRNCALPVRHHTTFHC